MSKLTDSSLYLKLLTRGRTFPLAPTETDGAIAIKTREKVELLSPTPSSLSFLFLFFFFSPLLFLLPPNCLVQSQVRCPHCHMLTHHWLFLDFPYQFIHTFGFPSSQVVTHVPHGPHLGSCLTCSAFDTWLNVSHSNKYQVSFVTLGASKNVKL